MDRALDQVIDDDVLRLIFTACIRCLRWKVASRLPCV